MNAVKWQGVGLIEKIIPLPERCIRDVLRRLSSRTHVPSLSLSMWYPCKYRYYDHSQHCTMHCTAMPIPQWLLCLGLYAACRLWSLSWLQDQRSMNEIIKKRLQYLPVTGLNLLWAPYFFATNRTNSYEIKKRLSAKSNVSQPCAAAARSRISPFFWLLKLEDSRMPSTSDLEL